MNGFWAAQSLVHLTCVCVHDSFASPVIAACKPKGDTAAPCVLSMDAFSPVTQVLERPLFECITNAT